MVLAKHKVEAGRQPVPDEEVGNTNILPCCWHYTLMQYDNFKPLMGGSRVLFKGTVLFGIF